ncbi:hypothetical protein QFZ76_004056 [Streptomyces sp. V4I2]|nr:hypothetical protein [Streptomyces sp. V4I2]
MSETSYGIGEGPATRVSLSLPEGTAEAIRQRVGKREFSAFVTEAVERELRGQILDEYLAGYERRNGPISEQEHEGARRVFDEVFAEEGHAVPVLAPIDPDAVLRVRDVVFAHLGLSD